MCWRNALPALIGLARHHSLESGLLPTESPSARRRCGVAGNSRIFAVDRKIDVKSLSGDVACREQGASFEVAGAQLLECRFARPSPDLLISEKLVAN